MPQPGGWEVFKGDEHKGSLQDPKPASTARLPETGGLRLLGLKALGLVLVHPLLKVASAPLVTAEPRPRCHFQSRLRDGAFAGLRDSERIVLDSSQCLFVCQREMNVTLAQMDLEDRLDPSANLDLEANLRNWYPASAERFTEEAA